MQQQKMELIDGHFVIKGKQEKREPIKLTEQPPIKKEYSLEAIELRDRVIKGNQKLFDAWKQICEIDHESQQWKDELEKWHQATGKLSILCSNLKGLGYNDCLYIKYYDGLTEEEERVVMLELSEGKVTEVKNGVRTKNCLQNPDGFFCLSCPSEYAYWEKDAKELIFNDSKEERNHGEFI